MKASELRIGNLFRDKLTGTIIKVSELRPDKIFFDVLGDSLPDGWQAEPIPLTAEILEKIPKEFIDIFRKCKTTGKYVEYKKNPEGNAVKYRELFNTDMIIIVENPALPEGWKYRTIVAYVHEVQNLYFCLTGEELKIQL